MGYERVSPWIRLGWRRELPWLLGNRLLIDPEQRLTCDPIEDVYPTRLARLGGRFSDSTVDLHIKENDGIGRIIVPQIMVNLLIVPPVLSRLCFHGQHRNGEKIISSTDPAVEVRSRITCGEIYKAQLRVHCRGLPHRGSAVLPRFIILRPGVMTDLVRARDRVESPDQMPIFRVVGLDAAPCAVLAAGKADDDQSVEVKGRGCNCVTVLPALGLNGPRGLARFFIQCHQAAIQLSHVNLAIT